VEQGAGRARRRAARAGGHVLPGDVATGRAAACRGGGALWDEGSCTSRAEPGPGQEGVEHTMTTERHLDWDGCALSATWAVFRRWRPGDSLGRWSAPTPPQPDPGPAGRRCGRTASARSSTSATTRSARTPPAPTGWPSSTSRAHYTHLSRALYVCSADLWTGSVGEDVQRSGEH
jgi:hypothetical protein